MIRNTLVLAALAANAAAGPCKPGRSSTELLSTTIESTETSYFETSITEATSITLSASATETSDAVYTTTSSEPTSEDYFFEILPLRRRLSKRDTPHYVGPNNPSDCTSATIYHLASGQLLDGEVPFYYTSGQEYQEFGTQGEPPADAVKTTFSIARDVLRWENDAFGEAAFCQVESTGKVYIIFDSAPSNCQRVSLLAYKPGECQPVASSTVVSESIEASTDVESATTTAPTTSADTATSPDVTVSTDASIASSDATTTAEATTTSGSESTTTSADICVQSLTALNGEPAIADREADCSELNRVTVSSYEVTQTVYKRGNVIIVPTAELVRRADGDAATTIQPTRTPAYATYCDSPTAYYDACSELGVTAFTTTIPEPTATETITE
ncbi:hypothetical protein FSARC_11166 [Fusarium sarcochroum]|uniref:DUF7908 domain-containing protein n=1 Tax=Fusarium sarcochroum TaxID=1208366 RepID=A0A8H4TH30_9HYPO|nr:hypothetical protein FSARC_11166 [Fusarium sarcochroum]